MIHRSGHGHPSKPLQAYRPGNTLSDSWQLLGLVLAIAGGAVVVVAILKWLLHDDTVMSCVYAFATVFSALVSAFVSIFFALHHLKKKDRLRHLKKGFRPDGPDETPA
jgi:predicted membrane channel-forming protein YqfA (hemolysin III family)